MKEYKLEDLAKGKLYKEDLCSIFRLTYNCLDMEMKVREIYNEAARS